MTEPGSPSGDPRGPTDRIGQIRDELRCLSCRYPLRGLNGDIVTCPECGRAHNVANIIANRWRGRWYRAPGFNLLATPLLAAVGWCLVIALASVLAQHSDDFLHIVAWIASAVAILVWIALIGRVVDRFGRGAILLTLLIQLIFPLYLIALIALLVLSTALIEARGGPPMLVAVGAAGVAIAAISIAKVLQRLVARRCIRLHLHRLSDEGTMRP
jgi:hypothetical protein